MKRIILTVLLIMAMLPPFVSTPTPAQAATPAQINQAIQDGLAWLAVQQNANGGWYLGYTLADTGAALLAFENEGNFPGGGATYSARVENGLNHLFTYCNIVSINNQTVGYAGRNDNPDSNGNGKGIYFSYNSQMYETGIVMQAIVASNTPDRVVTTGNCSGMTYKQVMTDIVDWVAWGQLDGGPGRGGWFYSPYNNATGNSDNSAAQWPVLGLIAAENWGIYAPQWVKTELNLWVTYCQDANGASCYNHPGDLPNVAKTGGLLVEMFYLGDNMNTARAQKAINYINTNWQQAPSGSWYGNKGQPYAMFAVFKGLELMKIPTMSNAPANPDTPAGDWWGDYSHYLVTTQIHPAAGQGYWSGYSYWNQGLATPWYIVILQATVFPVTVGITVPDSACNQAGYDAKVQYAVERFPANGTVKVYKDAVLYDTITLNNFQGTGSKTYTITPAAIGVHNWKAVMDVTGGGISAHAESTDGGSVYDTPQVSGIPDQTVPFVPINLDAYRTCIGPNYPVTWSATGVPAGWTVAIAGSVATVTSPPGATTPANITFTATAKWQGIDCSGSDTAKFSPNRPPVAHAGKPYGQEEYEVPEGGSVLVDGSKSYDPDGDPITYAWDLNNDGIFETPGVTAIFSAANLDGYIGAEAYIHLQVCDNHGACDNDVAEVEIQNVAPTVTATGATINENGAATVSGNITDPGKPDTFKVVATWGAGEGSTTQNLPAGTKTYSATHQYLDDNPTATASDVYAIKVTVTDDDGGVGVADTTVTVNNLVPVITGLTATPLVVLGNPTNVNGTFTDVGTKDTHTVSIDWGDLTSSAGTVTESNGSGTFAGSHVYGIAQFYTITVTLKDDDTGTATQKINVIVTATGKMTGGGSVDTGVVNTVGKSAKPQTIKTTHGFELFVNPDLSIGGNLQYNDHRNGDNFHVTGFTSIIMINDPALNPENPVAKHDTAIVKGVGRLNKVEGIAFEAVITDNGEPGRTDTFSIKFPGGQSAGIFGKLEGGNHQAHPLP